jgi:hypothetical protein
MPEHHEVRRGQTVHDARGELLVTEASDRCPLPPAILVWLAWLRKLRDESSTVDRGQQRDEGIGLRIRPGRAVAGLEGDVTFLPAAGQRAQVP